MRVVKLLTVLISGIAALVHWRSRVGVAHRRLAVGAVESAG